MTDCTNCWAYKWDCEDYCLIIGYKIQRLKEYRNPEICEDLKIYEKWRSEQKY